MFGQSGSRNVHGDRNAAVGIGVATDVTVVTFGNVGADRKPQPQASRFARHKRHHEAVDLFLRDLGTVVDHLHAPVAVFGTHAHEDLSVAQPFDGVGRVLQKIENRKLNFPGVDVSPQEGLQISFDLGA